VLDLPYPRITGQQFEIPPDFDSGVPEMDREFLGVGPVGPAVAEEHRSWHLYGLPGRGRSQRVASHCARVTPFAPPTVSV
jgi:hypothetical protein